MRREQPRDVNFRCVDDIGVRSLMLCIFIGCAQGVGTLPKDPCDIACPKTLLYVCGSNGETYANNCALEVCLLVAYKRFLIETWQLTIVAVAIRA